MGNTGGIVDRSTSQNIEAYYDSNLNDITRFIVLEAQ